MRLAGTLTLRNLGMVGGYCNGQWVEELNEQDKSSKRLYIQR